MSLYRRYRIVQLDARVFWMTFDSDTTAKRLPHFAAGFRGEATTTRPSSDAWLAHHRGQQLRAQLDSGALVVRQSDLMLVAACGDRADYPPAHTDSRDRCFADTATRERYIAALSTPASTDTHEPTPTPLTRTITHTVNLTPSGNRSDYSLRCELGGAWVASAKTYLAAELALDEVEARTHRAYGEPRCPRCGSIAHAVTLPGGDAAFECSAVRCRFTVHALFAADTLRWAQPVVVVERLAA